jgi:hypothetical protein
MAYGEYVRCCVNRDSPISNGLTAVAVDIGDEIVRRWAKE